MGDGEGGDIISAVQSLADAMQVAAVGSSDTHGQSTEQLSSG